MEELYAQAEGNQTTSRKRNSVTWHQLDEAELVGQRLRTTITRARASRPDVMFQIETALCYRLFQLTPVKGWRLAKYKIRSEGILETSK